MAISKLLLVVRAWINEQNKYFIINKLLSQIKPKVVLWQNIKNRLYNIIHGKRLMFTH